MRTQGKADYLIFTGDLLHRPPPGPDDSLAMILDVMRLREELGNRLIYLMGNHEFPHRYTITLQKGDDLFTPRFEWAMGQHRPKIMALLDSLPFYVRTKSGVSVCHAGAFPEVDERLFDVGETIKSAESLLPKLGSIFT